MDEQREIREVRQTNDPINGTPVRQQTVLASRTVPRATIIKRIVWFIAGFVIVLLAIRFSLLLLGANSMNGFVNFVYVLSYPFASPFFGIFAYQPSYGVSTLEISSLVAVGIYALIAWGIGKLLTLGRAHSG